MAPKDSGGMDYFVDIFLSRGLVSNNVGAPPLFESCNRRRIVAGLCRTKLSISVHGPETLAQQPRSVCLCCSSNGRAHNSECLELTPSVSPEVKL
eukprot:1295378-Amphidinium_carterae.1